MARVESEEGQGSIFWFTARFLRRPADVHGPSITLGAIEGVRVLGVDDNATNRRVLSGILDSWGCRHVETDGAASALARLREAAEGGDPYRIAILDMLMPDMAGDELGRRIKADPLIRETALVMMTSVGRRGEVGRFEGIGFEGYLTKPVKPSQLRALLMALVGRQHEQEPDAGKIVTRYTLAEASRRKTRLLLAEDNITNQKVAVKVLEKMGHRVDPVANGVEAIKALATMPYDIVLMDVQMPEMDGLEATRRIRGGEAGPANARIPIIAMTAHAMKGDRERCLAAGMDDYVSKPISPVELSAAIVRWSPTDAPQEPASPAPATASAPPPVAAPAVAPAAEPIRETAVDRDALLARLGGDEALLDEVVRIFLDDVPHQLEGMDKALAAGDAPALRRLAHTLKGSGGTAGALKLQAASAELEKAAATGDLLAAAPLIQPVKDLFADVDGTMRAWLVTGCQE